MYADALHLLALADPPPVREELGSLLTAIQMDVHWLDKRLAEQPGRDAAAAQAIRGKCQNLRRLIDRAVDSLERVGCVGLWAALEGQAHEFAEMAELELEWDMQPGKPPELPGLAAMAVFRIFQKMLSNVRRHAQASRIAVRIAVDLERLRLTVEDNGNGASAEALEAPGAGGVRAMREQARQLRGHIAIASEVGHGCAVTLVLPLKPMPDTHQSQEPPHEPQRRHREDHRHQSIQGHPVGRRGREGRPVEGMDHGSLLGPDDAQP